MYTIVAKANKNMGQYTIIFLLCILNQNAARYGILNIQPEIYERKRVKKFFKPRLF